MAIAYNSSIVTNGLVLCLDAANPRSYPGSGATWYDVSGNNNHCVFASTPAYVSGASKYFTFDGSSNYGIITNNSTLNFSSAQTLLMVMKHTYTSGRRNPWNQAYAGYGTWTHEQGENITQFYGNGGGDSSPYVGVTSAATPRSVWNFMCASRNTSTFNWYLNDSLSSSSANPYGVLTASTANILIGNGYAGLWQGDMAFVLAYTTALSAVQVTQNFNAIRGRYGV